MAAKGSSTAINYDGIVELPGGLTLYVATVAFASTDTTVDVYVPMSTVIAFSFGLWGTPGTGEGELSINETVASDGTVAAPTGKLYTITRATGTTSALNVSVWFIGR